VEARGVIDAARVAAAPSVSATATGTAGLLTVLLPILWTRWRAFDPAWPDIPPEVWGPLAVGLLVLLHKLVTRLELASDRRFALRVLAAGFYPLGPIPPDPGPPPAVDPQP
jgi:hypothetical protein